MNFKISIFLVVMIIFNACLITGCIEINGNDDEKKKEPISITEVLILNVSKIIDIENSSHNFTVTKIDDNNVILRIDSQDMIFVVAKDVPTGVDTDLDGTNDIEITINNITGSNISITILSTTSSSNFKYIEDDTGATVKVPKKIDTIVSLAPSITEILFQLNLGNKIVGRDSASNYPGEAEKLDVVMTYEGIDLEKILSKDPDIIIMDKTLDLSEKSYNKMRDYGLCVFRIYPRSLQDVLDNIELIGEITGTESKAKEVVDDLENRINIVKTRESSQPKILHILYYDGASSPWVATSSTFSGDLIQIAGGLPVVQDDSGNSIQITIERVIKLDPDIIFTSQDQTWPTPSREAIISDEALSEVTAVKNDKVIDVNADLVDRPGPRLVDGLELFSNYISA